MAPSIIPINCNQCQKPIKRRSDSVFALQLTWHKHCFRCLACKERLKNVFYPWQNSLYCRQHYLENYSHFCQHCSRHITGLVMVSGDISFHPECFQCAKCRCLIGNNDNYVFEERSRLYCTNCYELDTGRYLKYKEFRIFCKAAIHQIHISPAEFKKRQLQFKCSKDTKENNLHLAGLQKKKKHVKHEKVIIEKCWNDTLLKQGDTLLEINGIPVTSNNIKLFTELLEAADTSNRVSITVERIPEQTLSTPATPSTLATPFTPSTPATPPTLATTTTSTRSNDDTSLVTLTKTPPTVESPLDPEVYKRNVSYFNFSVLPRCGSDSALLRYNVRKLAPLKEGICDAGVGCGVENDGLTSKDKVILNRLNHQTPLSEQEKSLNMARCHSLERLDRNVANDFNALIKQELLKAESPLHRAQSMKVNGCAGEKSCVFRPSDLEFGQTIGKGFFGEVVLIKHKITGEEMVMKKLFDVDPEALEQFMKEVHVLKSLNHPNVLPFIGVMYQDTILHLILEYIKGGTLRALLKNKFIELSWKTRMLLAKDVASGVTYLHTQNIMHRDLKSKNVLIKKKGGNYTALVADFGLASVARQPLPFSTATSAKKDDHQPPLPQQPLLSPRPNFQKRCTVVGTAFWMAPEMLKGEEYDETVDVFSFGIVLCEIMTRLRNDGDTYPRTKAFGLDVEKFKELINPGYPEELLQLLAACCQLKPEDRPSFSCCEKWLEAFLTHVEFDIPLPDCISFQQEPQPLRLNSLSKKTESKSMAVK